MAVLLKGTVVVITGCSTGIGRAIAIESARHGAKLVIHHIGDAQSNQDIQTLRTEIAAIREAESTVNTVEIAVDVTDPEAGKRIVDTAVATFGEINAIVHNAGICQFEDFIAVSKRQLDKHMEVNFSGPFAITQDIVQQMMAQGKGGAVVSIASITATLGSSQLAHYSATKAAVLGMTASCAVALGKHGIRFNAVSPGTVETAMNKADLAGSKRGAMEERVPLERLGMPEDIAKPVVFLLSDMAQYISGHNLIVDGGASVHYQ
ncbi:NAD(P)-binding protein [Dactylonectria estremocensis]|uniref:NAD(P)-binding protein n=1 Tax=Dactylonectria estremocensis TaxID=1079267 RepID=A0A9P9EN38_9HYPO|nr:NAD(P)-binding protein [Dactylonectria estremocensis]